MSIHTDLFTILNAALPGKCHRGKAPDGITGTYVVFSVVSGVPENTMSGNGTSTLRKHRAQIDVYSPDDQAADSAALAIEGAMAACSVRGC